MHITCNFMNINKAKNIHHKFLFQDTCIKCNYLYSHLQVRLGETNRIVTLFFLLFSYMCFWQLSSSVHSSQPVHCSDVKRINSYQQLSIRAKSLTINKKSKISIFNDFFSLSIFFFYLDLRLMDHMDVDADVDDTNTMYNGIWMYDHYDHFQFLYDIPFHFHFCFR